jgi:hypothetical protein
VNLAATLSLCDGTNSLPPAKVTDYTTCEPAIMAYDDTKVQAIINEIDGKTSDGTSRARVPTIFGMNFQQVSVGEKLRSGGTRTRAARRARFSRGPSLTSTRPSGAWSPS